MDNIELKPCPFCLSNDIKIDTYDSGYKCRCNNCGCNSKVIDWSWTARDKNYNSIFEYPERKTRGIELATEAWNNRTPVMHDFDARGNSDNSDIILDSIEHLTTFKSGK